MKALWALGLFLLLVGRSSSGQAVEQASGQYDRRQTFAIFGDYSNDSSHIVLGKAPNRKWGEVGFQYEYRLTDGPRLSWRYTAEFRPLAWESDVTTTTTLYRISPPPPYTVVSPATATLTCQPGSYTSSSTDPSTGILYTATYVNTCGRHWTYVTGFSPFGSRINLRPHARLQPTANLLAGLLVSAKQIPLPGAGSFNFTFEVGAGLEYYLRPARSLRLEYQYQHFSNAATATDNPGVDNGLFKLTYAFGR